MNRTVPWDSLNCILRWPHSVIMDKEGPNDGLVSMESAKWVRALSQLFPFSP